MGKLIYILFELLYISKSLTLLFVTKLLYIYSGILSGYVFQLTFFVGWLTIDARRYFNFDHYSSVVALVALNYKKSDQNLDYLSHVHFNFAPCLVFEIF